MKFSFLKAVGLILLSGSLFAKSHHQALSVNLLTLPFGNYEGAYEKQLDPKFSLGFNAGYYDSRKVLLRRLFSYGWMPYIGIAPKLHLFGETFSQSFYVSPTLKIGFIMHPEYVENGETHTKTHGVQLRTGLNMGYQKSFGSGLFVDLSSGLEHYHTFHTHKNPSRLEVKTLMIRPIVAGFFGFRF